MTQISYHIFIYAPNVKCAVAYFKYAPLKDMLCFLDENKKEHSNQGYKAVITTFKEGVKIDNKIEVTL